jgi:hypothetical protein
MLLLKAKFLKGTELEARGNYPASALVSLYDPDSGEALNLIADRASYEALVKSPEFAEVAVKLRWRSLNLASLGGTGRGRAYRLQIVGVGSVKEVV